MNQTSAIAQFVSDYTSANLKWIRFAWNGRHAVELVDANQDARSDVIHHVLEFPDTAPVALLRDLFVEEARWCREARVVSLYFSALAELLLRKGGVAELDAFLTGLMASFDTFGACHQVRLTPPELAEFIGEIDRLLRLEGDPEKKTQLRNGRDLFHKLKDGTARKGWVLLHPGTPASEIRAVQPPLLDRMKNRVRRLFSG
jgi:hypothetical protein